MLRIGLIGFSGTGKSTLFQLLTGAAPDPGAVARGGQIGTLLLPDDRLPHLQGVFHAAKVVRPHIELLDTPGIDPGGAHDAGHVFGLLRQADALLYVLRAGPNELADQHTNLKKRVAEADRLLLEGRLERIETTLKKPRPTTERLELQGEKEDVLATLKALSETGHVPAELQRKAARRGYALLSGKPSMVVLNVPFDELVGAEAAVPGGFAIDAAAELELAGLTDEERHELMEEFGVTETRRELLLQQLRDRLGLVVFYTGNEREVRAWVVLRCTKAPQAAGMVHSDMERGFIRAEVARAEDLIRVGSDRLARAQGVYRVEGKDYHVADGDVLYIRFSA